MLELWGDIGFLVFTFSSAIFTFMYLSLSRWYKSFTGSLIAVYMFSIVFLCCYLSLRIWDIQLPGVDYVRLIMFWVLGLAMVAAVIGFLEIQFGRRGAKVRSKLASKYSDVKEETNLTERQ